jgi:hypothetical protein
MGMLSPYFANCRSIAPAARSTSRSRLRRRTAWFSVAVEEFQNWNPKKGDRITWLTARVNARQSRFDQIKRNTISLNIRKIEASAKERSPYATG